MKIDTQELRQVAATETPRYDMYSGIHKAMRALMSETLLAVGRMDTEEQGEVDSVLGRVGELLEFCWSHLKHENEFVHAAIEARAPGASAVVAHEHEEHARDLAGLADAVDGLRSCPPNERAARAQDLYRRLGLFIAANLQHMHVEETAHNAVLWARYTDAELAQVHEALVKTIPPQEMMFVIRWMVPFMTPAERAGMLGDMKANAPAPAFDAALDVVRPHLSSADWAKLTRSLGVAPVL